MLGVWGSIATCVGIACAWAYSAEPIRLKKSGWFGPGVVGLCYEGLPWFTGAAVMAAALPDPGPERAAKLACIVMAMAQIGVIALLLLWGKPVYALSIAALLLAQIAAMRVLLGDPKGKAPWYNGTGVLFYVSGMMIAAFALRSMGGI